MLKAKTLIILVINDLKKLIGLKKIKYLVGSKRVFHYFKYAKEYEFEDFNDNEILDNPHYILEVRITICLLWLCGIRISRRHLKIYKNRLVSTHELEADFNHIELPQGLTDLFFENHDQFVNILETHITLKIIQKIRKMWEEEDPKIKNWFDNLENRRYNILS